MGRILLLTQVLPYPLDAGPKVRAYHMLRHLAQQHQVTLVSFARPADTPAAVDHLRGICHAVHAVPMRRSLWRNARAAAKGVLTGQPMVVTRDEIGQMRATLRQLVRENAYDVVHADQLSMAGYGQLAARLSRPRRPRTLLDEHNAIHVLVRRMADTESNRLRRLVTAREARAFARYERAACETYDALLTVTEEDREHLLALFPGHLRAAVARRCTVVPICVDPDQVVPVPRQAGGAPTILHVGTMFWPPNVAGVLWFAREVLPLVHKEVPEARFVVVGKDPPPEVQALGADPRVEITGYVPELTPYLEQADAFWCPLLAGGGMRVKILDAWLWGLPVVSTSIGREGIDVRDGDNILVADDPHEFAGATVRLLTGPGLNQKLRANGRAWVESHYAWSAVYRRVDEVYARLLEGDAAGVRSAKGFDAEQEPA